MLKIAQNWITVFRNKVTNCQAIIKQNHKSRNYSHSLSKILGIYLSTILFFVWGTTPYISMSALPFGKIFLLLSVKKTTGTMYTVWCRHGHSDWQSTEAFLYVIVVWNYVNTNIYYCPWYLKKNTSSTILLYTYLL